MLRKFLILILLATFPVKADVEATELNAEDVVRGKKSKTFCNITATCAKIRTLKVLGNVDIRGNLTVEGTTTIASPVTIAAPVTVTAPVLVAGAPVTIGNCTLTCNNGVLTVTSTGGTSVVGAALAYGYIYNLTSPGHTIALEAAIPFDSNGPLLGVTHTPSSSSIGVVSAGTYLITFSVSTLEPSQIAIFVNGVPSGSTIYGSGAGTQQNFGQAILTLGAGDTITLVNHTSAAALTLQVGAGGTAANANASIRIVRLA